MLPKDAECPTWYMKFLEIIKPVRVVIPDYDYHIAQPVVGEYLMKKDRSNKYTRWRFRPTESAQARELAEFIRSPLYREAFGDPRPCPEEIG